MKKIQAGVKIVAIAGNQPEIIKLSEVVKLLNYHNNDNHVFLYKGQHYSFGNGNGEYSPFNNAVEEMRNSRVRAGNKPYGEMLRVDDKTTMRACDCTS